MKQKTAIRQLIEELEFVKSMWENESNEMDGLHALKELLRKSQELEPVNEQQIKDAYNAGESDGINAAIYSDCKYESDEIYIIETFEKP